MRTKSLPILEAQAGGAAPELAAAAQRLVNEAQGPRSIRYVKTLRVSVTDRCNFRCLYCMPEEGMPWLPKDELLTYEEIVAVARAAITHNIRDFKITGGEPLLRSELTTLIEMLRALPGVGELSLTTNGLLLDRDAAALRAAGITRVTVSLDTLDRAKFRQITRTGDLDRVLEGIQTAESHDLGPVKINMVVMRGYNLEEVADFARLTLEQKRTVRFIEFMPLAKSMLAEEEHFVPYAEIRGRIEAALGPLTPADADTGSGPARVFRLPNAAGKIGFIHAMSAPFCSTCNRLRLTADGQLRSCLFDGGEIDVRPLLRPAAQADALRQAFLDCVVLKPDAHLHYGTRQMSQIGG